MANSTPASEQPPPGPLGELVKALKELHTRAGLPSRRKISYDIRQRHDLRDTVSHETVSAMLRGDSRPSWVKYETVVRYLAEFAVYQPNEEIPEHAALIARFQRLWLACENTGVDRPPDPATPPPPQQRPEPTPPLVAEEIGGDPPPRNTRFVGREHQLRAIHEILRTGAPILTLTGIGGVGKTQLAAEYVYRFRDDYDLIWWVPAENASPMRASLAALGEQLGLPRSGKLQHPPTQVVLEALSSSGLHWLLVLDNARQPREMPVVHSWGSGKMLLTSRDPDWADRGPTIDIDVFAREESVTLLQQRANMRDQDADTVADKLGDLPLAVDQVANWHAATGTPVSSYLDRFDEQVTDILADPATLATSYPATVASFLTFAIDQLSTSSPTAAQLLELFGWLGAEPLPLDLLRRGRHGAVSPPLRTALRQEPLLNHAVRELSRHGLVSLRDRPTPRIQVHRLFQNVLRDRLTQERLERGRENVHGILAAANPGEPDDPQFWPHYEAVGPHIQSADLGTAEDFEVRRVVLDQARYLYRVGHYEESRTLSRELVTMVENSPPENVSASDHNFFVLAQLHLANVSRELGDYATSRRLIETSQKYMASHRKTFGPNHEYHTIIANVHALNLRISGKYEQALVIDRNNLDRTDPDDPDKMSTNRNNVAVNYRLLGRFTEAHDLDRANVAQWRDVQRRERDPRALLARTNLARDLYGLGRYAEARDILRATLPVYREVVGDKHARVLLANRTMVMILRKLGDTAEALALARDNRHDVTVWLDPGYGRSGEYNHEYSLAAGMSLVNAYLAAGELGNATVEAKTVLAGCVRVLGENHPMTLAMLVNSATVLRALGDLGQARRRDEDAMTALRTSLGADHPFTLCANNNFAIDLVLLGHEGRAHDELKSVCARSAASLGADHPDTIANVINRALVWSVIGGRHEDHPEFPRAVAALETALDADHPQVIAARARRWLGCDIEPPPL